MCLAVRNRSCENVRLLSASRVSWGPLPAPLPEAPARSLLPSLSPPPSALALFQSRSLPLGLSHIEAFSPDTPIVRTLNGDAPPSPAALSRYPSCRVTSSGRGPPPSQPRVHPLGGITSPTHVLLRHKLIHHVTWSKIASTSALPGSPAASSEPGDSGPAIPSSSPAAPLPPCVYRPRECVCVGGGVCLASEREERAGGS